MGQQKNVGVKYKTDIALFETMMFYIEKVLKPAFDDSLTEEFEQELNRLFRTSSFNIPVKMQNLGRRTYRRTVTNRMNASAYGNFRPCCSDVKASSIIHKRSPLISVLFPSPSEQYETTRSRTASRGMRTSYKKIY